MRAQKVARGHCAWCPDHSKHSVRQALQLLLQLRYCNPSPSLPLRQLRHLPPPTAPERVHPPPEWPCLWSQSLAVAFAPAALPLGQGTTHPPAGGHVPSGLCWQAALPSSRVCSIAPCLCPSPGALPAPHHPLPQQALLLCPGHSADWEA